MSNLDNILDRIYCLSQDAQHTVKNLRSFPHVAKNSNSYQLCEHLHELNIKTLRAFKDIQLASLGEDLHCYLEEILSEGPYIEETYGTLVSTIFLPSDHVLIRKLKSQIDCISLMLSKLIKILNSTKTYTDRKLQYI